MDDTTLVLVEISAGNTTGIGFTYSDVATAFFIENLLKRIVLEKNVLDNESITQQLTHAVRNLGNCGVPAMAISAIDNAMWDAKAKILNVPLSALLGKIHDGMLLYGSGGFPSYAIPLP